MSTKLIKNGLVYTNDHWIKTNILVENEDIKDIGLVDFEADEVIDASDYKIIPGLLDPHVHFSLDCGTIRSRDDFISGSRAAIYGGVTTFIDFLDPSKDLDELEQSLKRIELGKDSLIDYHFHGCIREPNCDLEEYVQTLINKGIRTIKLFTTYSETHRRTSEYDIERLLELSKKFNILIVAHVEKDDLINHDTSFLAVDIAKSRSSEAEYEEVKLLADLVRKTKGYLYIVHLSSGRTLDMLIKEYYDILGNHLFIESCPQYFYFDDSCFNKDDGYLYTFAPPLRSREEKELLIKNIDFINTIGTDHCSFTKADKESVKSLKGHPFGIGGIETSFLVLHKMFGDKIINKMSKNVAHLEGFSKKGEIIIGNYADLVFLKDCDEYMIGKPHGNADYSIYEGIKVNEEIVHVMNRGRFVLYNKDIIDNKGNNLFCKEIIYG